ARHPAVRQWVEGPERLRIESKGTDEGNLGRVDRRGRGGEGERRRTRKGDQPRDGRRAGVRPGAESFPGDSGEEQGGVRPVPRGADVRGAELAGTGRGHGCRPAEDRAREAAREDQRTARGG